MVTKGPRAAKKSLAMFGLYKYKQFKKHRTRDFGECKDLDSVSLDQASLDHFQLSGRLIVVTTASIVVKSEIKVTYILQQLS